jgi:putative ABC transport system permease protein
MERGRRLPAMLALDLWLATRNIVRQRRRSAVGLGAVAAGVVALLLASGFFEWTYRGMRESTIRARIGHIQVMRPGYLQSGAAQPFKFLIPETSEDRSRIEAFPQVDVVAPRLVFNGLISVGESTVSFLGEGVDPERERKLSGALVIPEGENLSASDNTGVILGQGLASSLGVKVGQTVVLLANTASGGTNAVEAHVRGVFATATKAYDDYAVRIPLVTAQRLLRVSGVHTWLVLLQRTSETDKMLERIRRTHGSDTLELVPWYETSIADFYNKTVSLFSKQVLVVKIMIAVIIVLSISNTMMTNVRERVAEIGTCMALGDRRRTILRRFLAEGAVMGLFGGVIGAIIGIALAFLISWIGIPMPAPPGMARGYIAGILVTPGLVVDAVALSVVTALLAGLYPAWKAANMNIVDALRAAH